MLKVEDSVIKCALRFNIDRFVPFRLRREVEPRRAGSFEKLDDGFLKCHERITLKALDSQTALVASRFTADTNGEGLRDDGADRRSDDRQPSTGQESQPQSLITRRRQKIGRKRHFAVRLTTLPAGILPVAAAARVAVRPDPVGGNAND